jgi:hypothetical protein
VGRRSPLLADGQAPRPLIDAIRTLEEQPRLPSFTVAQLQAIAAAALEAGMTAYCTNETGGAVPVFFDGTNWKRVTDRATIS